jgi:hypothetical protein
MKAVAVQKNQPLPSARIGAPIAASAALVALAWSCGAAAEPHEVAVASADTSSMPRLEVATSTLPRFDGIDSATRSSRIDMTLLPRHRRSALGLALGVSNPSGANPALGPVNTGIASVDLGLHWRYTLDNNYRFDVTAYRRVPNSDAISLIESSDPTYGARVEFGMGSIATKTRGFVASKGFLGFQLESGARVTIKRSHGVPMLYYRNTF